MGDSNYTSNIVGSSISASGLTTVTANSFVKTGSYFQIGEKIFVLGGDLNTSASIVAVATAISASVKGSLYLSSSGGRVFYFSDDTTASFLP